MAKTIRLDRFLAEMGKGSRTRIKEAAKQGRIQVNGTVEKKTERKINPETDQVLFDLLPVRYRQFEYIMLNKPQGVVSATRDSRHRTVTDLLDKTGRTDLFPVGRLDIDTEGLLLLTNDGRLAHRLLAPKKHVDKQYYAELAGVLPDGCAAQMAAGMILRDQTPVLPARLEVLDRQPPVRVLLTIQEGKFHQVKRMFEVFNCQVTYLKRLSMGPLRLDESLQPGEYRSLTEKEKSDLL